MTDRPTKATTAGRAYLALRQRALAARRSTEELHQQYALEGFIDRMSSFSGHELVLKGGALLAAYDLRRPTRDVDIAAKDLSNDVASVQGVVEDILRIARDDGLVFGNLTSVAIREDDAYSGVRVTVGCTLATANVSFHVDVSVGDVLWPGARRVAVARLLGGEIHVLGYPLSMIIAEKVVTALQRRLTNTRWRDFDDVYRIASQHAVSADELGGALGRVARARGVALRPLSQVLVGFAELGQTKWSAWVRKQNLVETRPRELAAVVAEVSAFVDPLLVALQPLAGKRWDPAHRQWG